MTRNLRHAHSARKWGGAEGAALSNIVGSDFRLDVAAVPSPDLYPPNQVQPVLP